MHVSAFDDIIEGRQNPDLRENKLNDALKKANQCLDISVAMDYEAGIAGANYILGLYHKSLGEHEQSTAFYRKSLALYYKLNDLESQLQLEHVLSYAYVYYAPNRDSAHYYLDRVIEKEEVAIGNEEPEKIYIAHYLKGNLFRTTYELDSSNYYLQLATRFGIEHELEYVQAHNTHIINLLDVYDYYNAIEVNRKMLEAAQSKDNLFAEIWSLMSMGYTYGQLGIFDESAKSYQQVLDIADRGYHAGSDYTKKEAKINLMLANLYGDLKKDDRIEELNEFVGELVKDDPCYIGITEVADLNIKLNNLAIAEELLNNTLEPDNNCRDLLYRSKALAAKAALYLKRSEYEKAYESATESYAIAVEREDTASLNELNFILSRLEGQRGNFKLADSLLLQAQSYKDSITTLKLESVGVFASTIAEQQNQIELIKRENETLKVTGQRNLLLIVLASAVLLSLVIFIILLNNRRKLLRTNQQTLSDVNENLLTLKAELNAEDEAFTTSTQRSMQAKTEDLSRWGEDLIELNQKNISQSLLKNNLIELKSALKLKLEEQDRLLEDVREIAAVKEEELRSFNYTVGHDLKLPLANAKNFIDLLILEVNDQDLDEQFLDYIQEFKISIQEMHDMIDGINAYTRADNMPLALTDIRLNELVGNMIEELKHTMPDAAKVDFKIDALPSIKGDELMFRQVFRNLLSNAIKFSAKATNPTIAIAATSSVEGHRISVRDNGTGIPEHKQAQIFQLFQTAHNRAHFKGTGVGLSIVKRIIERHGGSLSVESEVGAYTQFSFHLPKAIG
ncbi:MAG: ATP-binding protein [Bacteroidota bacterium]